MTLLGLLAAVWGPSQPAILPPQAEVTILGGDRITLAIPLVLARPSAATATSAAARPQPLKPQLQWQLAAIIDWQHWVATASVAVVPNYDNIDSVVEANAREVTATTAPVSTAPSPEQNKQLPMSNAPEPTIEARDPLGPQPKLGCPAYDSYLATELPSDMETGDEDHFAIRVKNVVIGYVNSQAVADQIAENLRQAMPEIAANPAALQPQIDGERGAGYLGGQRLFTLSQDDLTTEMPAPLAAIQWVHHLRLAFEATPLNPSEAQMVVYGLGETDEVIEGTASWYGPYFHGRQTATGEIFDQEELTAAHKTLPFDTYLEVKNLLNGKTIVVRINDRGPYVGDRTLDLSYAAARCLDSDEVGLIPYEARILTPNGSHPWQVAKL